METPISPKVKSGANWAGYATLLLTLLTSITPDMLTALGRWAPLVYGVIVGGTYALGAYLKADPLRDAGAASNTAAADAPASVFPAVIFPTAKADALPEPAPVEVVPVVPAPPVA